MTNFKEARAFLLKHRTDYDAAVKGFRWPDPAPFNWALDWFDAELARDPQSCDRAALWIVDAGQDRETKLSFATLSRRSNQVANFLRAQGLKRGDHLLLLLGNVVPLWETMLAAMKLGVVVIPATTLLTPDELQDRLDLVGPVLVADELLPGSGPGADLAGQQRLQAGLRLGADGEGSDVGTGRSEGRGCGDAARQARAGDLSVFRRSRSGWGGFFRNYQAR